MNNLIDIYTKIKLRIGCEIIVTYYRYGKKYTNTVTLLDVWEFVYIFGEVKDDNCEFVNIEFFSNDTMIESIKVFGTSIPIYYNPYVSEDIFNNSLIDTDCAKEIMYKVLGEDYDYENFCCFGRDILIEKYIARDTNVMYDDLFFSDKQKEEFEIFFKMLTDELVLYAKRNNMNSDVKFICSGKTSLVYEIGDKIIKIGKPRRSCHIPYCEFLLQPIINCDFSFDGYPMHVEVTQKVLVLENNGKSLVYSDDKYFNEIVDELRKNLHSIGLGTKDLHPGNVGILLNDNKIHYDEISFDVGDELITSIENNNALRILGKGKFVIVDLDCLKIDDIVKYSQYLSSIGYDMDKILDIPYYSKCLSRK